MINDNGKIGGMTFKNHQVLRLSLSVRLGKCIEDLRQFHDDQTHLYWSSVNDIMGDCYRLQYIVNGDYKEQAENETPK